MRITTAVAIVIITNIPAQADVKVTFPVSIPQECMVLAQREGVPTVIENKYQAAKAKLKLARLSGKDPLVVECRAAVERAKAQATAAAHDGQFVPGNTTRQSEIRDAVRSDPIR